MNPIVVPTANILAEDVNLKTGLPSEKLFHFIWQFQYFNKTNLYSSKNEEVQILYQGKINHDQGPDFLDAKVKIGNTILAGNIELHILSSDWERHKHDTDKNYKNVILHVVFYNDKEINNNIPVLELQPRISSLLLNNYAAMMNNNTFIACQASLPNIKSVVWISWKERLLIERLQRKSSHVLQLLEESKGHWEEVFWWLLCRNFGVKINATAFENIARSIPVSILAKCKHQIHQLEALLLGQANLLNEEFEEEYPKLLQREYNFLKHKYSLIPSAIPVMFLRMRPQNFPSVRLAQLAALVQNSAHLFSKILHAERLQDVRELFQITANDYWHYHYMPGKPTAFKKKHLGSSTIDNILINTVIPVVFSYGLYHKEQKFKDKCLSWMEEIAKETNTITKGFDALNVKATTAYDTQALIELKNEYCNNKKCLDCAVGASILKQPIVNDL